MNLTIHPPFVLFSRRKNSMGGHILTKIALEQISEFLGDSSGRGYDRQDAIEECEECISELQRRSVLVSSDKGVSRTLVVPEAQRALSHVRGLLQQLRTGDDIAATAFCHAALAELKDWRN
jgi:hypothetical protein